MKNNIFNNAHQWKKKDVNTLGLPRPFAKPNRKDLAKKVPIPWQSEDCFDSFNHLGLNVKNENKVYVYNLCPYCGIEIKNTEIVIRWKTIDINQLSKKETLVYSDIHPFHIECMKESRIFCPHMKKLKDEDFEIGKYKDLKINAIFDKNKSIEIRDMVNKQ